MTDQNFSDIAPFDDTDFRQHVAQLVGEPQFQHAVIWVMPNIDYDAFAQNLLSVNNQKDFQLKVMGPFLEQLERTTTSGITCDGLDNYQPGKSYTLISNHRDIVLDASFLNLCLIRGNRPTSEVAIGNNLLIMPWIDTLVRLNKSFIVKRDTGMRGALDAAKHLSAYIHYAIQQKHQSIWIAHREGRAKDSNDRTQESLIKMLALEGGESPLHNLRSVNLLPVSISYEFDPNDYLKAKEFLMKRRNPDFKKSQHDDLLSMETGILQPKGRIHFSLTECLNPRLDMLSPELNRAEVAAKACILIDNAIHSHYRLFPINYVAYDLLHAPQPARFADQYSADDVEATEQRLATQLAKVDVPNLTTDEMNFMRQMVLTMYANPLCNKLKCASR